MKLMLKKSLVIYSFFFIAPAIAQEHPTVLKIVDERPSDYDPNYHLITSDIEPISKKTFALLFVKEYPLSVVQAHCKTEENTPIVRYYSQKNFATLWKSGDLTGIYDSFSYAQKITHGSLEVTSFANYIESMELGNSSNKQLIKNWEAIYEPKKKKCCTPMRALATGTTLVGMGVLALIFSNWESLEKCCPS